MKAEKEGGKRAKRTDLRHPPIDDKVRAVDETALVAGEEEHGLG